MCRPLLPRVGEDEKTAVYCASFRLADKVSGIVSETSYGRKWGTCLFAALAVVFLSLLMPGCSSSGAAVESEDTEENEQAERQPSWVQTSTKPEYSAPRYVDAVGTAEVEESKAQARKAADQNAFSNIADQIFADVSSSVEIKRVEVVEGEISTIIEKTTSNTTVESSLTAGGLKIEDRYYDSEKEILYSLGVLDRRTAIRPHLERLSRHKDEYEVFLKNYDREINRGEFIQALQSLGKALDASLEYEKVYASFQFLASSDLLDEPRFSDRPSPTEVYNKLSSLLSRINLEVEGGDGQKYLLGKPLPDPLSVRLTLEAQERVPLEGVPVRFWFENGKGEVRGRVKTRADGKATVRVQKIERSSAEEYSISAELDLSEAEVAADNSYSTTWNEQLAAAEEKVIFRFDRKRAPRPVTAVTVINQKTEHWRRSGTAEEIIAEELGRVNINTVTGTEVSREDRQVILSAVRNGNLRSLEKALGQQFTFLFTGEVQCRPRSTTQEMEIFTASGTVRGFSVEAGAVGSLSLEGVRGFGTTKQQAEGNCIQKAARKAALELFSDVSSTFQQE